MSDYKFPELPSDEELGITDEDREHLPDDDGPEMSAEEMRALLGDAPAKALPPRTKGDKGDRAAAESRPKEKRKKAKKSRSAEAPAPAAAARPAGTGSWRGVATLAALALLAFLSSSYRLLPAPAPPDAPDGAFSSARAMAHLRQIARAAHPTGSPEHARVRGYIVNRLRDLGLQPAVETSTSMIARGSRVRAATVRNIVARIPGTGSTGTLVLTAHYDAAGIAVGAGDDATGVVAILETLRALRSGPPLRNDILVLVSDAEELGLLGARAFVESDTAMAHVAAVLSVEMRGGGGPSIMFETGSENGWIVREMATSGIRPAANSIGYEIYTRLPNDTDFTPFREAGKQGLNFAAIGRASVYHQAYDTPDNLQEATLQHQGENLLGVARRLGDADLSAVDAPSVTYFSVPLFGVVAYGGNLAVPFAMGLIGLTVLAVVAVRRVTGGWSGLLPGAGLGFAAVALTGGAGFALGRWLPWFHPEHGSLAGSAFHHEGWYVLALLSWGLAVVAALYSIGGRRRSPAALALGGLLLPLGLATWVAFTAPMAAMNLQWPLAAALLGLVALMLPSTPRALAIGWLWAVACAVPVLVLLVPVTELLWIALGFGAATLIGAVLALVLLLLLPALTMLRQPNAWWAPLSGLGLSAAFVYGGIRAATPTAERPAPAALAYALDRSTGEAVWITDDSQETVDDAARTWVEGVVGGPLTETRSVTRFGVGTPRGGEARVATAPPVQAPPPSVWIMMDTVFEGRRLMRLAIRSNLGAEMVRIQLPDGSPVRATAINGRPIDPQEPQVAIDHWGIPDPAIVLDLSLPAGTDPDLSVVEHLYHTEGILGQDRFRRPPTLAPDVRWASDRVMVLSSWSDLTREDGALPSRPEAAVAVGASADGITVPPDGASAADSLAAPDSTSSGETPPDTTHAPTTRPEPGP